MLSLTVGVGDVATVPDKAHGSIVDLTKHGRIGSVGVGVAHIVDDGDGKRLRIASFRGRREGENIGLGGAVAGGDLVVVCLGAGEVLDLHIVEELAALCGGEQGAGRCAVVSGM